MDLPIDHFRLLGISPASEAEAVLRTLQVRLDNFPEEGFTREALTQRAELLRLSAELLSDSSRRQEYEAALLKGAVGLEISTTREVGGLMLLWEAKAAYEAFRLARQSLQPPQAPALGSGREADLTLVAALACKEASLQEKEDRHYESAASLLRDGVKLLQRMGKLHEQRKTLEDDLAALLPYRILDLLSRDLGDQESHDEGLRMLNSFVLQRGGLEGKSQTLPESGLEQSEFELFFHQIRNFLTVQEQVDLFTGWQRNGSADAGFLRVMALVADGFYHRKPERIFEARKHLERFQLEGVDPLPLLGCLDLLLADVELAKRRFFSSPDEGLQVWLKNYPSESLAALCDYCRDWLRRDVLPAYRDVNAKEVDLEAWFADRDVQNFVESLENNGILGRRFSFFLGTSTDSSSMDQPLDEELDWDIKSEPYELKEQELVANNEYSTKSNDLKGISLALTKIRTIASTDLIKSIYKYSQFFRLVSIFLFLTAGIYISWIYLAQRPRLTKSISEDIEGKEIVIKSKNSDINTAQSYQSKEGFEGLSDVELLNNDNPDLLELKILVESWLKAKSATLSGFDNDALSKIARPKLIERVISERSKDRSKGEKQYIFTKITSLDLVSRTPKRIELIAVIDYRDKRIAKNGKTISMTSMPELKVRYILGRDNDAWRLQAYISGS